MLEHILWLTHTHTHLYSLAMIMKHIDPNDCSTKLWISGLYQFVVVMFSVAQCIKTFHNKLKQCFEVLRRWWCDKYVSISAQEINTQTVSYWVETPLPPNYSHNVDSTLTPSPRMSLTASTHPNAMAAAIPRPRAADLPRPLPAVSVTVLRKVFSEMASINTRRALAWSRVSVELTRHPAGCVSCNECFNDSRSGDSPCS